MMPGTSPQRLTVITGPSGVGKGTLVKELLLKHQEIWLSISATTRLPRAGEIDGKDYFFYNLDVFKELVSNQGFLEWAEFAGNLYGTPFAPMREQMEQGKKVLLEIELKGARQIRNTYPEAFQIFLAPPSFEELESRIRGRATDDEEAIQKRLLRAKDELQASNEFNAVVINDSFKDALIQIEGLMGLRD